MILASSQSGTGWANCSTPPALQQSRVNALDDETKPKSSPREKPHLKALFIRRARRSREIVRRPFFAKILNQSFRLYSLERAAPFTPQSEVDLVENWWARGGYNATGQKRDRTPARHRGIGHRTGALLLSRPIGLPSTR